MALNQERVDAQQNRLDFRIAQMAPIFPVPANENVPVRYGIHGYQWRSGDEDYDTDMSYFVNEYKKLNRDKVKFVYGYKFGFLFFDQKDALEFHKLMSDYVKAIGRGDVLNRLDYETKKQFLMDNIVGGPTEQEFAHGQYRLAEGTYMKEADGSDTKLSEREWLKASVAQPERFHFVSAAHDIIDASIESIDVWGLAKGVKPDGSAIDPESTDRIEGYVKADKLFELVPGLKDVSVLQNEDLQGAFCATEPDGNTVYIDNDVMWDARLGDATAQEELKESLVIGMKNYLGAHQIADSQIEALKPSDEIIRRGDYIRRPVRFHFVGVKGATNLDVNLGDNNISFLQHAKNLEGLGRMPESIKLDTGWEKGADGQWRLEIPAPRLFDPFANVQWMKEHPEVMRWRELNQKEIASALEMGEDLPASEQQELQQLRERDDVKAFKPMTNMKNPDRLTVKDYIDAPDLFAAYPEVADIPVKISILEDGQFAHLHIEEDILALEDNDRKYTIEISSEVANKAWGLSVAGRQQMFDSVVHEIQHYVQEVEGFALGANEEMFSDKKADVLRDINFVTDDHLFEERAGMGVSIRNAEDIRIQMDKRIGGHPISYYYADKLDTVARKYGFEGYSKLLEGFDNLPTRFQQYAYTAGEVEARNVVTRMRLKMTREERRHSLAVRTEDVPRKLQSVHLMHGVASDKAVPFMEKVSWIVNSDDENFRRQMFGRISSCIGDKSAQWTEKLEDNFTILKALWNTFPEGQKPHGYETMEDIEKFERRMLEKQEPLSRQEQIIREMTATSPDKRLNLLRMFSMDMEYYLTNGPIHGYSDRNLSCGNFADQQAVMKALFESFPDDKKPEWITLDKIEGYQSRYNMRPPLKDGIYDVDVVLRKEYVGWAMDAWYKSLVNPTPGWLPAINQIEVKDGRVVSFRGDYGLNQAPKIIGVNELTDNGLNVLYDVVRNENVREYAAMGDVINRMRDAGISIYPDRGLAYSRSSMSDEGRRMLDSGGRMYGFVRGDGTIFVDTNIATAETPIHEYTHLWAEVLRQQNPEEWKNIVMMMRDTPQWQQVRRDYPHLQLGDDIAEEALAHYSGVRGHQRLMESFGLKKDDGIEKLTDGQKGVFARVSEAIARFWSSVADFLHIHYTSKEQVADQILKDVMNRVNPLDFKKAMPEKVANGISRAHFIGEQGARNISLGRQTFLPDLLKFAKDSAAQGMDPAKIKMITGWEQGVDGKWRYEVANTKVKNMEITDGTTLKDVIDAPAVFEAYPELKDVKVRIGSIAENANYNNETKTITLNEFYTKREVTKEQIQRIKAVNDQEIADSERKIAAGEDAPAQQARLQELLNVRAVLNGQIASSRSISDIWPDINNVFDHEVQHAIQHIEGFAVGGSLRTVADMRLATAQALMDKFEEVYNEYKDLEWRSQNEENLELAMDYYDAKTSFEQEHGAEIAAYLAARQQRDNAELDIVSGMLSEKNFEEYRRLAGEVEARNVSERRDMSAMERRRSLAASTEDVGREDQIIVDRSKSNVAASVERPYHISYGDDDRGFIRGDIHVHFTQELTHMDMGEMSRIADDMGGSVRLMNGDRWADFFHEEDAVRFADKVVGMNEERMAAANRQEAGEQSSVRVYTPEEAIVVKESIGRHLQDIINVRFGNGDVNNTEIIEAMKGYSVTNTATAEDAVYNLTVAVLNKPHNAVRLNGESAEAVAEKLSAEIVSQAEGRLPSVQAADLNEQPDTDPELREARGYLMDVISQALAEMDGHVEIEHTELPSVPMKGDWKNEGNGHVFMELIKGEHNVKDAMFHDVHAEKYTLDEVVNKLDYSDTYALTLAIREAQIKELVADMDGKEIVFDPCLAVSREDNDVEMDEVDRISIDDDGRLNVEGHRLDADGESHAFGHGDQMFLNGYDELYAYVKEMHLREKTLSAVEGINDADNKEYTPEESAIVKECAVRFLDKLYDDYYSATDKAGNIDESVPKGVDVMSLVASVPVADRDDLRNLAAAVLYDIQAEALKREPGILDRYLPESEDGVDKRVAELVRVGSEVVRSSEAIIDLRENNLKEAVETKVSEVNTMLTEYNRLSKAADPNFIFSKHVESYILEQQSENEFAISDPDERKFASSWMGAREMLARLDKIEQAMVDKFPELKPAAQQEASIEEKHDVRREEEVRTDAIFSEMRVGDIVTSTDQNGDSITARITRIDDDLIGYSVSNGHMMVGQSMRPSQTVYEWRFASVEEKDAFCAEEKRVAGDRAVLDESTDKQKEAAAKILEKENKTSAIPLVEDGPTSYEIWKAVKEQHPAEMLLVAIGDSYIVYEDDARKAEEVLGVAVITTQAEGVSMTSLPFGHMESYLRDLKASAVPYYIENDYDRALGKKEEKPEQSGQKQSYKEKWANYDYGKNKFPEGTIVENARVHRSTPQPGDTFKRYEIEAVINGKNYRADMYKNDIDAFFERDDRGKMTKRVTEAVLAAKYFAKEVAKEKDAAVQKEDDQSRKSAETQQRQDAQQQSKAEEKKQQEEQKPSKSDPAVVASLQTGLLLGALATARKNGGLWLNKEYKMAPSFLHDGKPISAFNALMMALTSDAGGYKTNTFTTFRDASKDGHFVRKGESSLPFVMAKWDQYVNKHIANDVIDKAAYEALPAERKELYKAQSRKEITPIFNVDQTSMSISQDDDYAKLLDRQAEKSVISVSSAQVDENADTMQYLDELHRQNPGAILIVAQGEYYHIYGQDASLASATLDLRVDVNDSLRDKDNHPVGMITFPSEALDSCLSKLIAAGSQVAICDRLEDHEQRLKFEAADRIYGQMQRLTAALCRDSRKVVINNLTATGYDCREKVLRVNDSRNAPVGQEVSTAIRRAAEFYRAAVAYTGCYDKLNRMGRQNTLPEYAQKYDRLVQELAAGAMMVRQGLPATFSKDSMKLIPYWERELREDPKLLASIEHDVNSAVEVLNKLQQGKAVDYNVLRGEKNTLAYRPKLYSIANEIAGMPEADTRRVVVVFDEKNKAAAVLLPFGASTEIRNEEAGQMKNDLLVALKAQGYHDVTFYNGGGSLALIQSNDYFEDKTVALTMAVDGKLVDAVNVDVKSELLRSKDVAITSVQLFPVETGRYYRVDDRKDIISKQAYDGLADESKAQYKPQLKNALYVRPDEGQPVTVYPTKEDVGVFFANIKNVKTPEGWAAIEALGKRYYDYVQAHPDLEANVLMPEEPADVNLDRISKVSISKSPDNSGSFDMVVVIDNKEQPAVKFPQHQVQRFWLVDPENREAYKVRLAGDLYKNVLGIAEHAEVKEAAAEIGAAAEAEEETVKEEKEQEQARHQEEPHRPTFRR